ncbi:MAG: hypothetical protein IPF73_07205 [Betaproteobacteria bacterium]|nr:hypothetical protein [Betaproteobacteria bacterium]
MEARICGDPVGREADRRRPRGARRELRRARDADGADPAAIRWIDDPFLGEDLVLRHTPATPVNPLARILGFGERVAAEIARTTGGL